MVLSIKKIKSVKIFFKSNTELGILARAISWNVVGMSASKILLLILSVYAARTLGSEDFGKWSFIRTSISMFGVFLGFGLSVTPLKFIAKYINDKNKIEPLISFSLIISAVLGSILTALVFFSKSWLGHLFKGFSGLEYEIGIAAFFLFLTAMNSFFTGVLGGFSNFKLIAKANFLSSLLAVPVTVYLVKNLELIGLVYGYLIYYFLQFLFLLYFSYIELSKRDISISLNNNFKKEFKVFKSFSLPSLVSALVGGVAVWLSFAIAANTNEGFMIIGLYGAARIFQNSIIELSQQLNAPLISLISSNEKKSSSLELINFTVPLVIAALMIFPIMFLPELVTWLFNKGGYDLNILAIVISISLSTTYLMIFKQAINRKIITEEKVWWGVYGNILWASTLIMSVVYLVDGYGAIGLAMAFFLASLLDLIISLILYIKIKVIERHIALTKAGFFSLLISLIGTASVYLGLFLYLRLLICIVFCSILILLLIRIKYRFS